VLGEQGRPEGLFQICGEFAVIIYGKIVTPAFDLVALGEESKGLVILIYIFKGLSQAKRQVHLVLITDSGHGVDALHRLDIFVVFDVPLHTRQMPVRLGKFGVNSECLAIAFSGFFKFPQVLKRSAEIIVCVGIIRLNGERLAIACDGLFQPA
jgi:hypothetical protein